MPAAADSDREEWARKSARTRARPQPGVSSVQPIYELESLISYRGPLTLRLHGRDLLFDLAQPHERRYVLWLLFDLRYPQADIDRVLFRTFLHKGDLCLDIGANIGVTALEMLGFGARKVIAFEPVQALVTRLEAARAPDLEVHPLALCDRVGTDEILLSEEHNQGHSLMPRQVELFPQIFGGTPQRQIVETSTLDTFFTESAGEVWKVDVEGAEHALLRGASRLLAEAPPRVIFCECYENASKLSDLLGPDWVGARALLRTGSTDLVLSGMWVDPDPKVFAPLSPTYVFFRSATDALPAGLTIEPDSRECPDAPA